MKYTHETWYGDDELREADAILISLANAKETMNHERVEAVLAKMRDSFSWLLNLEDDGTFPMEFIEVKAALLQDETPRNEA